MKFTTWLDAEKGRSASLAAALGKSRAAISIWRYTGVPLHMIPEVAAATSHAVTEAELLRDAMEARIASRTAVNADPKETA